jgi:hypothetical protein
VITTAGRALARALTGAVYISAGYEAARAPGGRVGKADEVGGGNILTPLLHSDNPSSTW